MNIENHQSMAERRNKDKEIEELKARNVYLENKNTLFSALKKMSERKRLLLSLLWVIILISISLIIVYSIMRITKNSMETEKDYERIIGTLDNREWKVSDSTNKTLLSLFPSSIGEAYTIKDGDRISLFIPLSSSDKKKISFSYKDGRILSIYGALVLELEYTETVYGGGRTLSLICNSGKIVFKEKR